MFAIDRVNHGSKLDPQELLCECIESSAFVSWKPNEQYHRNLFGGVEEI